MSVPAVCVDCARRTWLLARLSGHLEPVRARIGELLALEDTELIEAVGGAERDTVHRAAEGFVPPPPNPGPQATALTTVCRCSPGYPSALLDLPAPPAVLHVSCGLERLHRFLGEPAVAVVGARQASAYGRETARALAAALAAAGLTVVSGMALGIDAAAHEGALSARRAGGTIAVLAGGVDVPYPASHRGLHARLRHTGVVLSELGPGVEPRRWMFTARNRIIAALAELTVLVQARERSGALLTVAWARRLGRGVGAVPGPVSTALSDGPHRLLRDGGSVITGAQDVLDELYGAGVVAVAQRRRAAPGGLLEALADGEHAPAAFARAGLSAEAGLAALAGLELDGLVRRGPGGRYLVRR